MRRLDSSPEHSDVGRVTSISRHLSEACARKPGHYAGADDDEAALAREGATPSASPILTCVIHK